MNTNLLTIVKEIVSGQGDSILSDPRKLSAFLSDLARDIPKPQKNALIKSLEQGSAQILKDAPEPERAERKQQLAQKLHKEEGLDLALCNDTMDLLAEVLFSEEQKKLFCKNCGKELQEGWQACPFCGTVMAEAVEGPAAVTSAVSSVISSSGSTGYGVKLITPEIPASTTTELQIIAAKNMENMQLKSDLQEMTQERNNANYEKRETQEKAKLLKGWLTAISIVLFVVIVVGGINLGDKEDTINYLRSERSSLQTSYNGLQSMNNFYQSRNNELQATNTDLTKKNELLMNYLPLQISSITVGNVNNGGNWINQPGSQLTASEVKYLKPRITYNNTLLNGQVTLFIKIIEPGGRAFRNDSSSPAGYTLLMTFNVSMGTGLNWDLDGWGNEDGGAYGSGKWTIEIWWNGIMLKSTTVTLN